jgi:hypothetical protein
MADPYREFKNPPAPRAPQPADARARTRSAVVTLLIVLGTVAAAATILGGGALHGCAS